MQIPKKIIVAILLVIPLLLLINKPNGAPSPVKYLNKVALTAGSSDMSREAMMDSLLMIGEKFIGKPYRYRGPSAWALDCSGFAAYLYSLFGYVLPHASPSQALLGTKVPMDSLQKGDLMFFKGRNSRSSSVGHTAIFYKACHDTVYMLHSDCSGIKIDRYNGYAYYTKRYLFSKRMNLNELKRIPVHKIDVAKIDSVLKKGNSPANNTCNVATDAGSTKNTGTTNSNVHIVKKGDTLSQIAVKYRTTVKELCRLNKISQTSILRIGQRIIVK